MSAKEFSSLACEVAVPRPVARTFAYRLPEGTAHKIVPGVRVRVPFGRNELVGIVDRVAPHRDPTSLKPVRKALDPEPLLPPAVLEVCRWAADYYVAPPGLVYRAALPPGLLTMGKGAADSEAPTLRRQVIQTVRELPTLAARDDAFGRARRQREAFEVLEGLGGRATTAHMSTQLGFSRSVLSGLVERGLARMSQEEVRRDPFADMSGTGEPTTRHTPTDSQAAALAELLAATRGPSPGVALLRGVTGSGKTLVYLDLLEEIVTRRRRSAIVLVPEISLTPQTIARFRDRFGSAVAVLHSGLSSGERYDEWRALREGVKRIVVGARSAVFAPLDDLGAIILDEEHEGTYKQSDTPRYHARSVAVMRSHFEGCLCLLGSATPSIESWANARAGRYRLLELNERVTGHPLPRVELVDLRTERTARTGGNGGPVEQTGAATNGRGDATARGIAAGDAIDGRRGPVVIGTRLREAIEDRLARGEQTILLLNRRGYATFVQCDACGHVWSCRQCNVSLTYHRGRGRLVCHHCGFEAPPPESCEACGAPEPDFTGVGTERVERRIGELFPEARLARMDVDTTGSKWAHFEILDRVRRGEVDILLGTQMIAKGLDFPDVTLVGVVNADVSLNLPDFRASERTFQILSQVAGRAGRGAEPGLVIVQTARPAHPALTAAAAHDYVAFATAEIDERSEPGYPPHRRLANLVVTGRDENDVAEATDRLAEGVASLIQDRRLTALEVLGPAPCPIDRIRGRWRWHALLKSEDAATLGAVLRYVGEHAAPTGTTRLEIDRDPESLM